MVGAVYMYVYKPNKEDTDALNKEIETLEDRYKDLKEKEKDREKYETEIVMYNEAFEDIVAYFPADLKQEVSVMFMKGVDEIHEGKFAVNTFGLGKEKQFYTLGDPDGTSYACYSASLPISYTGTYEGIKVFIEYIMNYKYRMNISSVSIAYDPVNDVATGSVALNAYCVTGGDRQGESVNVDVPNGVDNIFIGGEGAANQTSYPYDADNGAAIVTDNNIKILLNNANNDTADGIIVSAGGNDTYVTSSENKVVALDVVIKKDDEGKVMLTYSIGDESYTTEITTDDVTIYVKSSERVDGDDKNGVKLNVENTTDLNVFVKVADDDTTSPRFALGRKIGTVKVY